MSGAVARSGSAWRLAGGMLAAGATRTAETVVPVLVLGIVPVPVRRAQVPGLVVESAAPQHTTISLKQLKA